MERLVDQVDVLVSEDFASVSGGSSPAPTKETQTQEETQLLRQSKVVLFDDDEHTYDYVVEMLVHCCGLKRESAFRCAVEVDLCGRTTVFFGTTQECIKRRDRIHAYGADPRLPRSRGSMRAEVQAR
jgi:ATP-dependent Clp protease adaptor protein ClpS